MGDYLDDARSAYCQEVSTALNIDIKDVRDVYELFKADGLIPDAIEQKFYLEA